MEWLINIFNDNYPLILTGLGASLAWTIPLAIKNFATAMMTRVDDNTKNVIEKIITDNKQHINDILQTELPKLLAPIIELEKAKILSLLQHITNEEEKKKYEELLTKLGG